MYNLKMIMTMVDGKVINILTESSSQINYMCIVILKI